jgi:hypothetical protein
MSKINAIPKARCATNPINEMRLVVKPTSILGTFPREGMIRMNIVLCSNCGIGTKIVDHSSI